MSDLILHKIEPNQPCRYDNCYCAGCNYLLGKPSEFHGTATVSFSDSEQVYIFHLCKVCGQKDSDILLQDIYQIAVQSLQKDPKLPDSEKFFRELKFRLNPIPANLKG